MDGCPAVRREAFIIQSSSIRAAKLLPLTSAIARSVRYSPPYSVDPLRRRHLRPRSMKERAQAWTKQPRHRKAFLNRCQNPPCHLRRIRLRAPFPHLLSLIVCDKCGSAGKRFWRYADQDGHPPLRQPPAPLPKEIKYARISTKTCNYSVIP